MDLAKAADAAKALEKRAQEVAEHNAEVDRINAELDEKIHRLERAKSKLMTLRDNVSSHSLNDIKKAGERKWSGKVDRKHEKKVDHIIKSQHKIETCMDDICLEYYEKINSLQSQKGSYWIV
ncbi:hypothetical protein [uncultured Lactobacillus sp.]|uniref:hypothetical protein n=1 Tax=uncultured Lactobacillus sp. TaxID=153152 RepID=UPI00260EE3B5|nr:hypothetical protein [uncultured Lactobacillus sp.]